MKSKRVVKPKFTTDFPGAVVREGADEFTSRQALFHRHQEFGRQKSWRPPLVDADWHAICPPIYWASKDQNEWPCIINTRSCTKRSKARNLVKRKDQSTLGFERSKK